EHSRRNGPHRADAHRGHRAAEPCPRHRPHVPADLRHCGGGDGDRIRPHAVGGPDAAGRRGLRDVRAGFDPGRAAGRPVGPAPDDAGVLRWHGPVGAAGGRDAVGLAARRRADPGGNVRVDLPPGRHSDAGAACAQPGRHHRRERAGRQPRHRRRRAAHRLPGQVVRLADGLRGPWSPLPGVRPGIRLVLSARDRGAVQAVDQGQGHPHAGATRPGLRGHDGGCGHGWVAVQHDDQRQHPAHDRALPRRGGRPGDAGHPAGGGVRPGLAGPGRGGPADRPHAAAAPLHEGGTAADPAAGARCVRAGLAAVRRAGRRNGLDLRGDPVHRRHDRALRRRPAAVSRGRDAAGCRPGHQLAGGVGPRPGRQGRWLRDAAAGAGRHRRGHGDDRELPAGRSAGV
ncbi:MAG: Putative transport protein, partial [uncultured Ramlibacter sp.]